MRGINNKAKKEISAKSPACGMNVKLYDVKLLLILYLLTQLNKTNISINKALPDKGMTDTR